jgi:hypothetical protein
VVVGLASGGTRIENGKRKTEEVGHLRRCASKAPAATAGVCLEHEHTIAAADGVVSTSERRE